jgi:glucosamine--fructose-6-phosphate aminotransferase (isomerizing)
MADMPDRDTGMAAELREAPDAVRRQDGASQALGEFVARCRRKPPQVVVTCGRGSSAHAATFGKHLIERYLGIPVAAAAPNIATVYRQRLNLKDQLVLTISQSGYSDDLGEFAAMARASGALTVAIVNDVGSPLAAASEITFPVMAGVERSVAATKSFVATLAMLLRLTAAWTDDDTMRQAITRLPDRLSAAAELDWGAALAALAGASSLTTIGRGPTLAIAREAALKLKETCELQAEPFSSAEFQHGPMALVSPRYPILVFHPGDEAAAGVEALAADLTHKGAAVFRTSPRKNAANDLPALAPDHPDTDAVCLIQSFYSFAVSVAAARGTDANRPRHLRKVTRTR